MRRRYATYIPGPEIRYNENLVPIDEQLCALLAQRQQTGGDTPGYPGDERIKAWAERFHLDSFQLELLFRQLSHKPLHRPRVVPANLQAVLPIMRSKVQDNCEYTITHAMQYANVSIVYVQVRWLSNDEHVVIHPELLLTIEPGNYEVMLRSANGGGKECFMEFQVTPTLDSHLDNIRFGMVPDKPPQPELAITHVHLNQTVSFE